jgi:hypothetical protein
MQSRHRPPTPFRFRPPLFRSSHDWSSSSHPASHRMLQVCTLPLDGLDGLSITHKLGAVRDRVKEDTILAGHFQSTRDRFAATAADSPILILHDTVVFTYSRTNVESIGILHKSFTGKTKRGRLHRFTVCGILMHPAWRPQPRDFHLA